MQISISKTFRPGLDPDVMIRQSASKQKIPSFKEIMELTNEQAVQTLTPQETMDEEKLDSYALLHPSIYLALIDLENIRAPNVLLTVIETIKVLQAAMVSKELSEDSFIDIGNMDPTDFEPPSTPPTEEGTLFDDKDRSLERKF